jgi:pimeloyl-ACP methyl ester carboxylesterase
MEDNRITRRKLLQFMGLGAGAATLSMTGLPWSVRAQEETEVLGDAFQIGEGSHPWPTLGLMPDPAMDDQLLFYLSSVYVGMADIGEVFETVTRMDTQDPDSWFNEWMKTAERVRGMAGESLDGGHAISAGEAYLRAANYIRAALIHYPDQPTDPETPTYAQLAVDSYVTALDLLSVPGQAVRIPYEDTTLLGYFYRSPNAEEKAPVLITHQGRDAWPEETKQILDAAMKRGYHVLQVHGPGQGATIRIQGLPFRHDWEKVITPAIDFALTQPGVDPDRIVLIGYSMGGWLAPRAAAFDKRIKICIANPGVLNWGEAQFDSLAMFSPELFALLEDDPKAFDEGINQMAAAVPMVDWYMKDATWKHGSDSPSDLMMELKKYDNTPIVDQITCRMLIMDGEGEVFTAGQAQKLYDALNNCPKDFMLFTAEDTGLLHCQNGASAVAMRCMYDWLDQYI